jgi:hypothetical protein
MPLLPLPPLLLPLSLAHPQLQLLNLLLLVLLLQLSEISASVGCRRSGRQKMRMTMDGWRRKKMKNFSMRLLTNSLKK